MHRILPRGEPEHVDVAEPKEGKQGNDVPPLHPDLAEPWPAKHQVIELKGLTSEIKTTNFMETLRICHSYNFQSMFKKLFSWFTFGKVFYGEYLFFWPRLVLFLQIVLWTYRHVWLKWMDPVWDKCMEDDIKLEHYIISLFPEPSPQILKTFEWMRNCKPF